MKKNLNFSDNILYKFSITVFIFSLIAFLFEIRKIDNTIGGLKLFRNYAILGFIFGLLILVISSFYKTKILKVNDKLVKINFVLGLLLGFSILFPCIASFSNRMFANNTLSTHTFSIDRLSSSSTIKKEYFVFSTINGYQERFSISKKIWIEFKNEKQYKVEVKMGFLNYPFITKFKKYSLHRIELKNNSLRKHQQLKQ